MADLEPLNAAEYERVAEERLDRGLFEYIAGGAGDEATLAENVAAFGRVLLRPRTLVDVSAATTATTVLGSEVSMPLLVAPTALQRLTHPDGEPGAARAAAAAGTVYCLSSLASVGPRELADAAPDCLRWFQLYWSHDRGFTRELLAAVSESGYRALVLTVDLPAAGRRERDLRNRFGLPLDLPMPNLPRSLVGTDDFHTTLGEIVDSSLTWRDLEWLRSECALPLVLKGVLTAEDAVLAREHGVEGIVVSNHGGRQLDGAPAALDVLEEVVEAADGEAEVYLDGGVRRGTDTVKALALGARAVLVGRPVLWGLAAGGEAGVTAVLGLLREETLGALVLLGCPTPGDVGRAHVRPRP
ncbi:MAG TPA: alpha-hydroxy acid oxidase [Gaiellaceae bacterium]|nr:alpha-hydroxy acid oxidase [Gaiellaceae bacterium]